MSGKFSKGEFQIVCLKKQRQRICHSKTSAEKALRGTVTISSYFIISILCEGRGERDKVKRREIGFKKRGSLKKKRKKDGLRFN